MRLIWSFGAVLVCILLQQHTIHGGQNSDAFLKKVLHMSETIEQNPILKAQWDEQVKKVDEIVLPPIEFKCDVNVGADLPEPTNVHEVRPRDIKVVSAFGDSITAGNGLGASWLLEVAYGNRGESWSIGGDLSIEEGVVTMPNILRKFNPDLKGFSTCATTRDNIDKSWFNMANPGDKSDDFLEQAELIVERMKADTRVDYDKDWKLLTLFIGGNDLCLACGDGFSRRDTRITANEYYGWFNKSLTHLKANMPRAIVNLVSMFDVSPLQNMSTGIVCDLLQWGFCGCARNWTTLQGLRALQLDYHAQLEKLANDPRFKADDFTVVLQPYMVDQIPPIDSVTGKYLFGFLSPDCFHPNRVAHQGFALHLWNTMLTPVGQKPRTFDANDFEVPVKCPTKEYPYIFTDKNSITIAAASTYFATAAVFLPILVSMFL